MLFLRVLRQTQERTLLLCSNKIYRRLQHDNCIGTAATTQLTTEWEWRKPHGQYTGINVYNSATRRKVPLVMKNNGYVTWYTCGPTVYDSTHLGHASCYVKLDILQRILRNHFNYNLVTVMNITDIDDKIIQKSQDCGTSWRDLAHGYEAEFWSDLRKLNVEPPNVKVRVTDFIPNIVLFIERLVNTKQAYVGADNSVYFDVSKCENYGKLQNIKPTDFAEDEKQQTTKASPMDFALWKAQKTPNEPSWPSPWGPGRPGWHIECSTLASMLFRDKLDFHAGGLDLRFPHHENEEAQSCAYHNTNQWVNYWLHTGQLKLKDTDAQKMSKSLGNTISVSEMLDNYTADEFRMACLLSNYRNGMSYNDKLMTNARQTLQRFQSFNADCDAYLTGKKRWLNIDTEVLLKQLLYSTNEFNECLSDDFDTARAISVLIDQTTSVSRIINTTSTELETTHAASGSASLDVIAALQSFVANSMRTFGLTAFQSSVSKTIDVIEHKMRASVDLHKLVEDLLTARTNIRESATATKNKQLFGICDELRNVLHQHGIEVRDHSQGSSWRFQETQEKEQ